MKKPIQLPDKLFFRIGEVADLVGVRPHVLRYWEEELGVLRPMKTRGAHRQYRRRDVELALVIKRLLHEEGFTIAGARKRLREMGHPVDLPLVRANATEPRSQAVELETRAELLAIRAELCALLDRLDRGAARPVPPSEAPQAASDAAPAAVRVEPRGPAARRTT